MRINSLVFGGLFVFGALSAIFPYYNPDNSNSPLEKAFASDPTAKVRGDDPAMLAAFRKASATFADFEYNFRNPPPGGRNFVVKVGLAATADARGYEVVAPGPHPGSQVEYFWLGNLAIDGDRVSGDIDNDPETVTAVHNGERITLSRTQVADWMYMQGARMVGNATMCPELRTLPEDQRRALLARVGASCP